MKEVIEKIPEIDRKTRDLNLSPEDLAQMIDHTKLTPYKATESIEKLCNEAKLYNFRCICVNPYFTKFCAQKLSGTGIEIATVVGFPLGQATPEVKALEAKKAVEDGATEIDMVMNVAAFKDKNYEVVKEDIEGVVEASGVPVKVILETGYLTYEEIVKACEIVMEAGAHFVKTSTGFGPLGANIPHVYLMRRTVGEKFGVKAAGGVENFRDALRMVAAGANRIGTSSGVKIIDTYSWARHTDWYIDEIPCRLCPSRKATFGKMPENVFQYYKTRCVDCIFKEFNRFYE
ncbi:MAG: deoxyribose-phosphate aldolase [Candidatus Hadarchaeales archaeon]